MPIKPHEYSIFSVCPELVFLRFEEIIKKKIEEGAARDGQKPYILWFSVFSRKRNFKKNKHFGTPKRGNIWETLVPFAYAFVLLLGPLLRRGNHQTSKNNYKTLGISTLLKNNKTELTKTQNNKQQSKCTLEVVAGQKNILKLQEFCKEGLWATHPLDVSLCFCVSSAWVAK